MIIIIIIINIILNPIVIIFIITTLANILNNNFVTLRRHDTCPNVYKLLKNVPFGYIIANWVSAFAYDRWVSMA